MLPCARRRPVGRLPQRSNGATLAKPFAPYASSAKSRHGEHRTDGIDESICGLDCLLRVVRRHDCIRADRIIRHGLQIVPIRKEPPQFDIAMRFTARQCAKMPAYARMGLGGVCPSAQRSRPGQHETQLNTLTVQPRRPTRSPACHEPSPRTGAPWSGADRLRGS